MRKKFYPGASFISFVTLWSSSYIRQAFSHVALWKLLGNTPDKMFKRGGGLLDELIMNHRD